MPTKARWVQREVNVDFDEDGTTIILTHPIRFLDQDEGCWVAPARTKGDGASIPRLLWTVIGSPLTGKYRDGSILHDWYCSVRTRPWRAVHRMFYDSMICSNVSFALAKTMYAAVFAFGPHWSELDMKNIEVLRNLGIDNWQYSKRVVKIRTENCAVTPPGGPGSDLSDDESQIGKEVSQERILYTFPTERLDAEWALETFQNIADLTLDEIDQAILTRLFGDESATPPDIGAKEENSPDLTNEELVALSQQIADELQEAYEAEQREMDANDHGQFPDDDEKMAR